MDKTSKTIIVTGTPGTGKTTVAMRLARRMACDYVDVNKVISQHKLSSGYDRKKRCRIVDVKNLNKELVKIAKKHRTSGECVVIDSHLAHYMPADAVDTCIVTRCRLDLLKRRLKRRRYSAEKVRENMDCEIFEVCMTEAAEAGHNIIAVQTDKKVDYDKLIQKIKRVKKK